MVKWKLHLTLLTIIENVVLLVYYNAAVIERIEVLNGKNFERVMVIFESYVFITYNGGFMMNEQRYYFYHYFVFQVC